MSNKRFARIETLVIDDTFYICPTSESLEKRLHLEMSEFSSNEDTENKQI